MPDIYDIYSSIQTYFHDNQNEFCRRMFWNIRMKSYEEKEG